MILFLYNILSIILLPIWVVYLGLRIVKGKEDLSRIKERFGISTVKRSVTKNDVIWIHAASVGEVMSTIPLVEGLKAKYANKQILLTSGTITSAKIAQERLGNLVVHQFLPLDNYFCMYLFLKFWKPSLLILIDSEFWPVLITQTAKKCKVISVNTRISERSFLKWQQHNWLVHPVLDAISLFLPQSQSDLHKLHALGAKNCHYLGNLKYCATYKDLSQDKMHEFKALFKEKKILLAASTHPGEELVIAKTYKEICDNNLLLVIAPRHPSRSKSIVRELQAEGFSVAVRSNGELIDENTDIYLADTLGEMGYLYSCAMISVIGNSICFDLGHNPLEPAQLDSVIVTGPGISNFKQIYDELFAREAAFLFTKENLVNLLNNEGLVLKTRENAKTIVKSHQHTAKNMINMIAPFVE